MCIDCVWHRAYNSRQVRLTLAECNFFFKHDMSTCVTTYLYLLGLWLAEGDRTLTTSEGCVTLLHKSN